MTVLLPAARRLARALPPVACAALSGSALWAAFPPLTWTALAFVAWVPLIVAQFAGAPSSARVRALDGVFVGVFTGLVSVSVDPPEVITGWAWAGLSVLIGLAFGVGAALLAFPTPPAAVVRRLPRWGWVWLPALTWTGVEYLRLVTTAGHPWGMVATSQIDTAPLRALLPVAGMWPVTLLVVATNYAISALVLGVRGRSAKLVRGGRIGVVSVAAAWLAALGAAALPSPPVVGTLRVVAVQTGEHVPEHLATAALIETVQYAELTHVITGLHRPATEAAARDGARLVVWPEASGWVDPAAAASVEHTATVAALSARVGATIVWPYFLRIDPDRTRNELVLVRPDGTLSAPTTKDHPVWVIGERSITAGLQPVYEVEGVRVGLAAGPDGTYTDTLARLARNRAQLVALPTHDWQAYAPVQLAHLRARAAEHRLAVVRADWRYGSAVIGPDGALLAATPTDRKQAALLVATVDVTIPGSWYTVTGDWLGVAALAALGVSAAWAALPLRRRRRTGQAVLD